MPPLEECNRSIDPWFLKKDSMKYIQGQCKVFKLRGANTATQYFHQTRRLLIKDLSLISFVKFLFWLNLKKAVKFYRCTYASQDRFKKYMKPLPIDFNELQRFWFMDGPHLNLDIIYGCPLIYWQEEDDDVHSSQVLSYLSSWLSMPQWWL